MNSQEAFDSLLKIAEDGLAKTQQAGATYFASGDTLHVREAVDRVEKFKHLSRPCARCNPSGCRYFRIRRIYHPSNQWASL